MFDSDIDSTEITRATRVNLTFVYLFYVDESGDPGPYDPSKPANVDGQGTPHYILSGLMIPAHEWRNYLLALVDIKRAISRTWKLPMRKELHGTALIHPRNDAVYKAIPGGRRARTDLYKFYLENLTMRLPQARLFNIYLNKANPHYPSTASAGDLEALTWNYLIMRFEKTMQSEAKITDQPVYGLIFADDTNEDKVRKELRKMRVHNYIQGRNEMVNHIIEDPTMRQSQQSYFVQAADMVSHALYRKLYPKGSLKKFGVDKLFNKVVPLCHTPASRHAHGIVHV